MHHVRCIINLNIQLKVNIFNLQSVSVKVNEITDLATTEDQGRVCYSTLNNSIFKFEGMKLSQSYDILKTKRTDKS